MNPCRPHKLDIHSELQVSCSNDDVIHNKHSKEMELYKESHTYLSQASKLHISSKEKYSIREATPSKKIVEVPGIPNPSPIIQIGTQVTMYHLGIDPSSVMHNTPRWL